MKKIYLSFIVFISAKAMAQVPEDIIRYSWYPQNATARILGAGGVMGSVGGDLTAGFVNPAGIGFYHTNEATLSPGFVMNTSKTAYRGTAMKDTKNGFAIGPSGVVIALPKNDSRNRSSAFAIAITQSNSFDNIIHYGGLNNYSSYSQQFAEEFSSLNKSIDDVLNSNSVAPYTAAPALYTYLIDTITIGGSTIVKGAPEYVLDQGKALQQDMLKTTKGGLYELNLAYAMNDGAKWLWGGSIGIPIINYESNSLFTETDTSSDHANHFSSFSYNDNFTTKGAGLNGRLGIIYRPREYFRLGLAVHTPSYFMLTDSRETMMTTSLENPLFNATVSSKMFANNQRGEAKYIQSSAWRAILSASYVFREIEDVTKQRGFISADLEYVNYKGSKFSSNADQPTDDQTAYYKQLNGVIKNYYKGNINFRLGGELKFNTIMVRAGMGYYGNPYSAAPSKANKMTLSGGLGYRNKGFFTDISYVYLMSNDFDVPYRLSGALNTYASIKQTRGNIAVTAGVKF